MLEREREGDWLASERASLSATHRARVRQRARRATAAAAVQDGQDQEGQDPEPDRCIPQATTQERDREGACAAHDRAGEESAVADVVQWLMMVQHKKQRKLNRDAALARDPSKLLEKIQQMNVIGS